MDFLSAMNREILWVFPSLETRYARFMERQGMESSLLPAVFHGMFVGFTAGQLQAYRIPYREITFGIPTAAKLKVIQPLLQRLLLCGWYWKEGT